MQNLLVGVQVLLVSLMPFISEPIHQIPVPSSNIVQTAIDPVVVEEFEPTFKFVSPDNKWLIEQNTEKLVSFGKLSDNSLSGKVDLKTGNIELIHNGKYSMYTPQSRGYSRIISYGFKLVDKTLLSASTIDSRHHLQQIANQLKELKLKYS